MSRIGNKPIAIPAGVTVDIDSANSVITVSGKLGTLVQPYSNLLEVKVQDNEIVLSRKDNSTKSNMMHGTFRALINDMVKGVSEGFSKNLIINGVGYGATSNGDHQITMKLGYSHPVVCKTDDDIKLTCVSATEIKVFGVNKAKVGQVAADIRSKKPVEPYHSHGIRYSDEVVVRKEGKTGKK